MPLTRLGGLCTLHQAGNTDEGLQHQRHGLLRSTAYFLPGLRNNDSMVHVFKFTAIQAMQLYQLIEHFLYIFYIPALHRFSDSILESMIY